MSCDVPRGRPGVAVRLASAHPKSKCVGLYARINKRNLKGAIETPPLSRIELVSRCSLTASVSRRDLRLRGRFL